MCIFTPMSCALENWDPPRSEQPDYYDTVKYVYKYIDFHISEDEAYAVLNAFIEKWDESAGQIIKEEQLVAHVVERLREGFDVLLSKKKIEKIVHLILAYLRETGHYFKHEL